MISCTWIPLDNGPCGLKRYIYNQKQLWRKSLGGLTKKDIPEKNRDLITVLK